MIKPKYKSILEIQQYKAGLSNIGKNTNSIKLSSNENAFGPSELSKNAFLESVNNLNRYPNSSYIEIRSALASKHNITIDNIVCGAGSDEIISLICRAYAGPGDEVLYSKYGFIMYSKSTMASGASPIAIPVDDDLKLDIDCVIKNISEKTKIIFIANPNNPTGSYLTYEEINYLQKHIPKNVLLVLDLAYTEYVMNDNSQQYFKLVNENTNIITICTFSKIYALAALRIGWCYCSNEVANTLSKIRGPFNISTPAVNAAVAAISDTKHIENSKKHNDKWLKIMTTKLSNLGIKIYPSLGNFYLAEFKNSNKSAYEVFTFLANRGIMTRTLDEYELESCLRITVGLESENTKLIDNLQEFLN